MELALDLISWALILAGGFFLAAGAIGLMRMPDFYTRMHAASLIDTLGAGLMLTGLMIQAGIGLVLLKLVFLVALLFFTAPVVTHALAQAALTIGLQPLLAEDRRSEAVSEGPRKPAKASKRRASAKP